MRLFHLWPAHDVERHNRPADRYFTATIDDVPPFYLAPIAIRATLNAYLGLAIVTVLVDAFEDTLRALQLVDRKDQLTMTVAKLIIECPFVSFLSRITPSRLKT